MKVSGSYDVATFSTSTEAEIRRLNAQVDLFWSLEHDLLLRYGLRDGMDILDCGCGPGRLIELLKGKNPTLNCTGLEMNPQLVEAANRLVSARKLKGVAIYQGTAEDNDLADTSFDMIIMRLVLEHVTDPVQALVNLTKLLRKDGRIVVISNDFEFHLRTWPPVPELDQLYDAYCRSRIKDGGDPCIGRRVPQLMSQTGLEVIGNEIETAHNAQLGDKLFLKAEGAGIPTQLVHTGFLNGEVLEAMTRSWRAMLQKPGHCIVRPLFVAVGKRSALPLPTSLDEISAKKDVDKSTVSRPKEQPPLSRNLNVSMMTTVVQLLKEVLNNAKGDLETLNISPDSLLIDLGLDSLTALELQERIKDQTGIEFPLEQLLENIPVSDLSVYLEKEFSKKKVDYADPVVSQETKDNTTWEEGEI